MKISLTGHKGRLGSELVRSGCIPLTGKSDDELDVTNPSELKMGIDALQPDVIINCAAFTNVDGCEKAEGFEKARKINFWGVENLKKSFDGRIIHISTDYVFDGKTGPYKELQEYNIPVNSYGYSKWAGEIVLLSPHRYGDLLIRTTGLYGRSGHHDFVSMVKKTLRIGRPLKVSRNLHGNQTYIPHLVEALLYIAERPAEFSGVRILNVASEEVITRYEFALMVASVFGLDKDLLIPVTNKQVPGWEADRPTRAGLKVTSAKRMKVPIYSILDGLRALHGENPTT